jgi:hypothetical protein
MSWKSALLRLVCLAVLCITLSLGLWPFHSPRNDVAWLTDGNGIAFGKNGTAMSSDVLITENSTERDCGSVEIWGRPDHWRSSATLLALYRPEYGTQLVLRQSLTDLKVTAEARGLRQREGESYFYVDDAFGAALRQKKLVFITLTCGQQGVKLYLDGILAKAAPRFHLTSGAFTGRVILGDSAQQPDSFRGQIRGLAIYESELSSSRVLQNYREWTERGRPNISPDEHNICLYRFDEHGGDVINSIVGPPARNLHIPKQYEVIDKIALEPFWEEFDFSRSYWSGNLKNIIGFIPFGFCFAAWLSMAHRTKRVTLLTVALGALVSLTIEIFQIYLPTRDSGTTDLITNTISTWLGVVCYRAFSRSYPRLRNQTLGVKPDNSVGSPAGV